jgi:pimeloyl-ACP methyl ester carboxylesterase
MTVNANNITIHYTQTGSGPPLLLLHGNGESQKIFRTAAAALGEHYTVYCPDTRSHGQSSRVKELHYADFAEDAAAFIRALGLERPALYGFSDGGITGLLLAIAHPELLSKLIVSGANLHPGGLKPGVLAVMKLLAALTRKDKFHLCQREPNIVPVQLAGIRLPVWVLAGEKDVIREEHTRRIAGAIPEAKLKILSGESHGSYVNNSPKLAPLQLELLQSES